MGSSISLRGRIAGSYPVQRLVIEPCVSVWNVFWSLDIAFGSWETFCPYEPPYYLPLFFPCFLLLLLLLFSLALFSLSKGLPGIERAPDHFRPLYVDSIS